MRAVAKVIDYLENEDNPFHYYVLTFLAACTLRNFFEFMVVQNGINHVIWELPVHYTLFYISFGLTVILLIHLISGERVERVARAVLAGFMIVITPPLIDLLLQSVWSYNVTYMYMLPEATQGVLQKYFLYLGDFSGGPPGIRIEVFVVLIGIAVYVFHKTSSFWKAALAAALVYSVLFWAYCAFCYPIRWFDNLVGLVYESSQDLFISYYLFLSLPAFLLLMYFYRPAYFKAVIRDIRPTRILHYELMVLFGLYLGYPDRGKLFVSLPGVLKFCFVIAAVVFALLFSIVTNNISDMTIDRKSNPRRPSVTGEIPPDAYRVIGFIALFLSFAYSLAAGYMIMFLMACFIGNYFLYSMPPLRLKRITFLSKGVIALNSLIMILAGYSFSGKEIKLFPPRIAVFVIICLTACTNFIDIKDYEGDIAGGIKTLPVVLGLKKSKLVIGSFFMIFYSLFPYLAGMPKLYIPSVFFGAALFLAITRKRYNENAAFGVYLLSGALLFVYLLVTDGLV